MLQIHSDYGMHAVVRPGDEAVGPMGTTSIGRRAVLLSGAALLAGLVFTGEPAAAHDVNSTATVNIDKNGMILRNYDPTSYVAGKAPRIGAADYSASSDHAIYRFASSSACDRFVANPENKPAFGGFCATGAALEKKLDGDPQIFRIHKDRLYVFVHQQADEIWDKDPAGTLAKANMNWPRIRDRAPSSL